MGLGAVRRGDALWRVAPGFLVVSSIEGATLQAGGSAATIWQRLPDHHETPVAVEELVTNLATEHGQSMATVRADVLALLDDLEAIGCAVREP